MTTLTNSLRTQRGNRLQKTGRYLTTFEKERYGKSSMLRFVKGVNEPIYPIGYIQHKNPMGHKKEANAYTAEGRIGMHDNLRINVNLMLKLMRSVCFARSAEYADNRISLFSAQWGKCAVTGVEFQSTEDIHCHHKVPVKKGGTDKYENLILVTVSIHKLIHAVEKETISNYMNICQLDKKQLKKLNELRKLAGNAEIVRA